MARKIFHILTVAPFIVFGFFIDVVVPRGVYVAVAIVMLAVFLGFEIIRLKNPLFKQKMVEKYGHMYKKQEEREIVSSIWGPINLLVLVLFFSRPTVIATLGVGGLSDPLGAMFGMKFGKKKNKLGKTWAGTLAHFVTSVVFIFLAMWLIHFTVPFGWILVLSALAALVERWFPYWDDNVVVPLVFALGFEGVLRYFVH